MASMKLAIAKDECIRHNITYNADEKRKVARRFYTKPYDVRLGGQYEIYQLGSRAPTSN